MDPLTRENLFSLEQYAEKRADFRARVIEHKKNRRVDIGPKTRDVLALVPDTDIQVIERCSGHDGTYGVRAGTYEKSQKIARPVINRAKKAEPDYLVSDCPMAATQIANGLDLKHPETNPLTLLRKAYGI